MNLTRNHRIPGGPAKFRHFLLSLAVLAAGVASTTPGSISSSQAALPPATPFVRTLSTAAPLSQHPAVAAVPAPSRESEPPEHAGATDRGTKTAVNPPIVRNLPVEQRLGTLDEAHPEAFFRLGEDAMDEGKADIARHLLVIAASLDENRFGRSACLALAQLARNEHDEALACRLDAIALLASKQERNVNFDRELKDIDQYARLKEIAAGRVSSMLGAYRMGEGKIALALLTGDAQMTSMIKSVTDHIPDFGEIKSFCQSHPTCATCKGDLIIRCPQCKGGSIPGDCTLCGNRHFIICTTCQGHPGDPQVSDDRIGAMLRFEVTAQDESEATWSMQMDFDHNAPRNMLDLSELPSLYHIDVTATRYVNGQWVKP